MHELSICEALLERVAALAQQSGSRQVSRISLQLGPLSGIDAGQLQRAFSVARAGTCAEAAQLQIEMLPLRVRCRVCAAESEVRPGHQCCATCGNWRTTVISGDELLLRRVELQRDEKTHV